jgi:ubiquinone/menaquinone biosynthesis C-methylase UbiE
MNASAKALEPLRKSALLEPLLASLRRRRISKHVPQGAVVADLGCGPDAATLRSMSQRISRGYGIDLTADKAEFGNVTVLPGNLCEGVPLNDASVDCVISLAVIEHVDNPPHMLAQAFRVLKAGGLLLMTNPTPRAKPVLEFLSYKLGIVSKDQIIDHKQYIGRREMETMLAAAKFTNVRCRTFQFGMNLFTKAFKP